MQSRLFSASSSSSSSSVEKSLRGQVYRVCFTGGPCGGKRTAMSSARRRLANLGFRVFTVPEANVQFFTSGAQVSDLIADPLTFQSALMNTQLAMEDSFDLLARAQAKRGISSVIVCERGAMDNKASTPPELWESVIASAGVKSEGELREGRYDLVLHLVTAADGAEDFYVETSSRGGAQESLDEARQLDRRVRECWIGHERLHIVDNSANSFDAKVRAAVDRVSQLVGAPRAPGAAAGRRAQKRKFVLRSLPPPDALPADLRVVRVNITTTYLKTPPRSDGSVGGIGGGALDATSGGDGWLARWSASTSRAPPTPAANADRPVVRRQRVRLRGTPGAYSPVLQTWWSSAGEIRSHMTEKAISIEDYESALTQRRDPDSATIEKQVTSFAWGGKGGEVFYWEVHHFIDSGQLILEVDAPAVHGRNREEDMQLPSFLDIEQEVTTDPAFSTYQLAQEWQAEYTLRELEETRR